MRRCDVLVQNKTIHSLNFSHLIEYFLCVSQLISIGKPHVDEYVVCIIVFIVSIWSDLVSLMIYVKH